jgi:outer membrane receptor protein involved in Fe transport
MSKVSLCKRPFRFYFISTIMALLLIQGEMLAGITGKISGRIIDAKTKEPIPSVNVVLRGTSLGAATDVDGYYYIINIPPGRYILAASMVGYKAESRTNVLVSSDHTTTVDFDLSDVSLEGEEMVVVAQREIVKKDVSSSQIVVDGSQIAAVPMVRDINTYINMQAGILDDQIRSGGLDQVGLMVDGLVSVDNRTNRPLMQLNMTTISEVSIIKGGFNAEYGNVRSGMINVVTKDPEADKFHISIDTRYSPARYKLGGAPVTSPDNYWNRVYTDPAVCWTGINNSSWSADLKDQYSDFNSWPGWSAIAKGPLGGGLDSAQWRNRYLWDHAMQGSAALGQKEITYGNKPDFYGEMTISGGVPLIGKYLGDMAFLISYRNDHQAYALPTFRPYYVNDNTQVKLISHISPSMKLGIEGSYGEVNTVSHSNQGGSDNSFTTSGMDILNTSLTGTNFEYAWWPTALSPFNVYTSMVGISLDHILSKSTFYNLRVSWINIKNSCTAWGPDAYRDTTSFVNTTLFGPTPMDQHPWGFWIGPNGANNQLVTGVLYQSAGGGQRDYGEVHTFNLKFDLTSQFDKYNQLKTGIDFTYDDLYTHYENIRFDSPGTQDYKVEWKHYPYRLGAYLQDKLEFEGMIANVGVRIDYNDPNCDWFTVDPYSKYFNKQFKWDLLSDAPTAPAKGHLEISPRLGISHPISENVKLYFSYGHFYSMPKAADMYRIEWGIMSNGIAAIGNPNASIPKTVQYELGVDWDVAGLALIHLAGFYKNIDDQINQVFYQNYSTDVTYNTYQNNNYSDVRGFEIQIERNFGSWINGLINYTYQVETHGNVGYAAFYQDPNKQLANSAYQDPNVIRSQIRPWGRAFIQMRTPSEWGPEILGTHPLSDWIIAPNISWRAGQYVTLNPNSIFAPNTDNNLEWKGRWSADLRVSKQLTLGKTSFELFVDVHNVLDLQYMTVNLNGNDVWYAGTSNDGFSSMQDRQNYVKSLHLPIYSDHAFDKLRASDPGSWIPGTDQLGDIKSADKPYINMPNRDFLTFQDPRYITIGVKINL